MNILDIDPFHTTLTRGELAALVRERYGLVPGLPNIEVLGDYFVVDRRTYAKHILNTPLSPYIVGSGMPDPGAERVSIPPDDVLHILRKFPTEEERRDRARRENETSWRNQRAAAARAKLLQVAQTLKVPLEGVRSELLDLLSDAGMYGAAEPLTPTVMPSPPVETPGADPVAVALSVRADAAAIRRDAQDIAERLIAALAQLPTPAPAATEGKTDDENEPEPQTEPVVLALPDIDAAPLAPAA